MEIYDSRISIKEVETNEEIELLSEFILTQLQFYPNFESWVTEKCIPRIKLGEYTGLIALMENVVYGDSVYRSLTDEIIEIKNHRVDPFCIGMGIGTALLREVEKRNLNKLIRTDVAEDNTVALDFFLSEGFEITAKERLYLPDRNEILLEKWII